MTTQLTQDLKPCPFCGNEPLPNSDFGVWYIQCTHCTCTRSGYETKAEATKHWNQCPASELEATTAERGTLLAACKTALDWLNGCDDEYVFVYGGGFELADLLRAAIAKAEGKDTTNEQPT